MTPPEKKRKRMTSSRKPSLKKKKKKENLPPTPEAGPNPSLPDDLLLSCIARVSRMHYPTLSLVSKGFRSLVASPELYQTRSSLGRTESCLYVCLKFPPDPNPRWFTLCRKPDRALTNNVTGKKSSGYALAKLPVPHTRLAHWSGLVTIGSNIYNIGGPIGDGKAPSASVSVLDCRSNTWREGPSMRMERNFPVANVVDGKICVAGGCKDHSSSDWMEVFDPTTQAWEFVTIPGAEICGCYLQKGAAIDGKVYIFGNRDGLAYKPREGRWERLGWDMDSGWPWFSYGVIQNVIYYYNEGEFKWCDTKARLWRTLKGVKGLPRFRRYIARFTDYGGKMAVFWYKVVPSSGYKDNMMWCAVIALERRSDEEIWGKVEWHDAVLTVPKSCRLECTLAATV